LDGRGVTPNSIYWYGNKPDPGVRERLERRGKQVVHVGKPAPFSDAELAQTAMVVFDVPSTGAIDNAPDSKTIKRFIDHGVPVLCIRDPTFKDKVINSLFVPVDGDFPWRDYVEFVPDLVGVHFDYFIKAPREQPWNNSTVAHIGKFEKLTEDETLLLQRAFPRAGELRIYRIAKGLTDSRVFLVYEKRRQNSIAFWAQPKLVKVGLRKWILAEVEAMREISHFIPFDLRPNLQTSVKGLRKALYVADFVDKSESLVQAAHNNRAEAALSNLFNRTLGVWRQCAWERGTPSEEPLAVAAERLKMFTISELQREYRDSESFAALGVDVDALWEDLKKLKISHVVGAIHGDLHGENVRVRGDDAILIDLGSVRGDDSVSGGAPISFDVAMLEVALAFQSLENEQTSDFTDEAWEKEVTYLYELDHILAASKSNPECLGSWLQGCIHRIRGFARYEHHESDEYPLALAIAMLRWCKFPPRPDTEREKGHRVVALKLAVKIIQGVLKRHGHA
jgi:hypothetical protein